MIFALMSLTLAEIVIFSNLVSREFALDVGKVTFPS